jgi:hypothetical protein
MSIVAYYARLSPQQRASWAAAPTDPVADIAGFPGAEMIDVDRAWTPIAWLVSKRKRLEDRHNWRVLSDDPAFAAPRPSWSSRVRALFGGKPPVRCAAIDASLAEVDAVELDAPLVAVEGRSDVTEARLDFGMGPAAVFDPAAVKALASALAAIDPARLEEHLDPASMDRDEVFPGTWLEDSAELMAEYIHPNFARLRALYERAAGHDQCVVVWYV